MASSLRVGIGYDAHPLVSGRRLVLGGVVIPFPKGLDGWSDADVLTHAVIDALLGAAALGDIGGHFPPGEGRYKDICSLELLGETWARLTGAGFRVVNIDATVIAEAPQLAGFIAGMRANLGRALDIKPEVVSVKATTSSGLGFTGRGEGIAAQAVALIESR